MSELVGGDRPLVEDIYVGRRLPAKCRTGETVRFFNALNVHLRKLGTGYRSYQDVIRRLHLSLVEPATKLEHIGTIGAGACRPSEIYRFGADLFAYLGGPDHTIQVMINQACPLVWVGRNGDRMALNLLDEPDLWGDQSRAAGYTFGYFGGKLPVLHPFEPHITIGKCVIEDLLQQDPSNLYPDGLSFPASIAVGGLKVRVNDINAFQANQAIARQGALSAS